MRGDLARRPRPRAPCQGKSFGFTPPAAVRDIGVRDIGVRSGVAPSCMEMRPAGTEQPATGALPGLTPNRMPVIQTRTLTLRDAEMRNLKSREFHRVPTNAMLGFE